MFAFVLFVILLFLIFSLHDSVFVTLLVATVSQKFTINLEGQKYVHFYVILSRNVKIFGIMASL